MYHIKQNISLWRAEEELFRRSGHRDPALWVRQRGERRIWNEAALERVYEYVSE
jgi:hypothetical protein